MVVIIEGEGNSGERRLLLDMYKERKTLFVDLLKWDVPVTGQCEIDQFDGDGALYLIALDDNFRHQGSLRLLRSDRAHVLADVFPELCDRDIPRGNSIYEISRLCLPSRYRAPVRLEIRHRLISAMVDHALEEGVTALTGVTDASFLEQILVMGWRSAALGYPRRIGSQRLGAFRIEIEPDTPERLTATGIYRPNCIRQLPCAAAA